MTEITALTIQERQALEAQLDGMDLGVAGAENLRPGDIGMPPRLRISQANRPIVVGDKDAPDGSIVNSLTGEIFTDGVDIVPIVFLARTRVMWPEGFATDNDPMCASNDGEMPAASSEERPLLAPAPGPCATCMYAKFGANGEAPRCKMQRNFLVWLVDQGEPAILTMQSTALSAARALTALAKTQGLRKSVRFVTQVVKSEKGRWHIAAFARGRKLEVPEVLALVEARNELQKLVVGADVSDDMRESNGNDAAPVIEEEDAMPF